jgi:hypothetical protein
MEICEAITLYYEILHAFEEHEEALSNFAHAKAMRSGAKTSRTTRSGAKIPRAPTLTLDDILLRYAIAAGDGVYRPEAEERCHKWAYFLISRINNKSDFEWRKTWFFDWMITEHPVWDSYTILLMLGGDLLMPRLGCLQRLPRR